MVRMASNTHAKADRAAAAPDSVPPVESFSNTNGDLAINLNRSQWMTIVGALSIAAGDVALGFRATGQTASRNERDYEQMFTYTGLCTSIGARLGMTAQTAGIGDLPPPLARSVGA